MAPKRSRAAASGSSGARKAFSNTGTCIPVPTNKTLGPTITTNAAGTTSLSASLLDDTNMIAMDATLATASNTSATTTTTTPSPNNNTISASATQPLFGPEPASSADLAAAALAASASATASSVIADLKNAASTGGALPSYISPLLQNAVLQGHPKLTEFLAAQAAAQQAQALAAAVAAATGDGENNGAIQPLEDEGCLHCHNKVKGMPRIKVLKEGEDGEEEDDEDDDDEIEALDSEDADSEVNIQVRCDECQSYICNGCHWCHEFQANHEIRVCDRCDAFYCKACDEMDQCDDCGEVVCGSCSTLLSCKFCGGGLCEECATACGR